MAIFSYLGVRPQTQSQPRSLSLALARKNEPACLEISFSVFYVENCQSLQMQHLDGGKLLEAINRL
jgi:hypothetical protein